MSDRKPSHIHLLNIWHPSACLDVPCWKLNLLSSFYHTLEGKKKKGMMEWAVERCGVDNQRQHSDEQRLKLKELHWFQHAREGRHKLLLHSNIFLSPFALCPWWSWPAHFSCPHLPFSSHLAHKQHRLALESNVRPLLHLFCVRLLNAEEVLLPLPHEISYIKEHVCTAAETSFS